MQASNSSTAPFFDTNLTQSQIMTPRHNQRRAAIAATAIILIGLVVAVARYTLVPTSVVEGSQPTAAIASRALVVTIAPIQHAGPDHLIQHYTGIVTARRSSVLAAKAIGRVEQIDVDLGDQVIAGQVLVKLDTNQLEAQRRGVAANLAAAQARLVELKAGPRKQEISQARSNVSEMKASLKLAEATFERSQRLFQSKAVSEQELDQSRYSLDAAVARLEVASKTLDLLEEGTRQEQIDSQQALVDVLAAELDQIGVQVAEKQILAPYAGQIQARFVDEGAIVAAGDRILEIVESNELEIRVGLPPELVAAPSIERIEAKWLDQTLPIILDRMSPSVDSRTRTCETVLRLADSRTSPKIPIGSSIDLAISMPMLSNGYWLPTSSLTADARGLWAVYVVRPIEQETGKLIGSEQAEPTHRVERSQVELLRSQGDWSEVRGSISEDDLLIVEGQHRISDGEAVAVRYRNPE